MKSRISIHHEEHEGHEVISASSFFVFFVDFAVETSVTWKC
jgi:hypothetical membrane protein